MNRARLTSGPGPKSVLRSVRERCCDSSKRAKRVNSIWDSSRSILPCYERVCRSREMFGRRVFEFMHYLLIYDVVDEYVERRKPFRADHLAKAQESVER